MAKKTGKVAPANADRACPNCGRTSWTTVPITLAKSDARDHDVRTAELAKLTDTRGDKQRCACGYETHAGDDLVAAEA